MIWIKKLHYTHLLILQESVADVYGRSKSPHNDTKILKSRLDQNLQTVNHGKTEKDSSIDALINVTKKKNHEKLLDNICRKAFPLSFFLFALIYWVHYLHFKWQAYSCSSGKFDVSSVPRIFIWCKCIYLSKNMKNKINKSTFFFQLLFLSRTYTRFFTLLYLLYLFIF